jgi:hypothetical protein
MALSFYRRPVLERRIIMSFFSWLRTRTSNRTPRRRAQRRPAAARFRPRLETLEDHLVPSTLTVTSAADGGPGSLRAEVAAAKNRDTIVFSPSLDGQTIALTQGELDIRQTLTIQGPGADQLTVSALSGGTSGSRVFRVEKSAKLSLSGLTISNGFAGYLPNPDSSGLGGNILNQGTLTMSACAIVGHADGNGVFSAWEGGGIFNSGTLVVINSVISGCAVDGGGGDIFNAATGTATASGSTISGNTADFEFVGASGGGIFNAGQLTISGCTVSSNGTDLAGGGIYNTGQLTVSGCTVSSNYAGTGGGGGIYNAGTMTVGNTAFSSNFYDNILGPYTDLGGNTFG